MRLLDRLAHAQRCANFLPVQFAHGMPPLCDYDSKMNASVAPRCRRFYGACPKPTCASMDGTGVKKPALGGLVG